MKLWIYMHQYQVDKLQRIYEKQKRKAKKPKKKSDFYERHENEYEISGKMFGAEKNEKNNPDRILYA